MENTTKCNICNNKTTKVFSAIILKKHNIDYYFCENCNFVQTEKPYWLNEAYSSAIGVEDTGLLQRNILLSKQTSVIINFIFNKNGKFVDYAGGYGVFVRLMRDIGFDFYWHDPFAQNILSKGFDYIGQKEIELVTAFECFEHFTNPLNEIEKMLEISKNILFSTRLFSGTPPKPEEWWYYSLNSGQHISFYSVKTLQFIAKKYQLNLNTNFKSLHLLSEKKINNTYFNILLKSSMAGLSSIIRIITKSKTDEDYRLLSN